MMFSRFLLVIMLMVQCAFALDPSSEEPRQQPAKAIQMTKTLDWMNNLTKQEKINFVGNCSAVSSFIKINKNWQYIRSSTDLKTDSKFWKTKVLGVNIGTSVASLLWDYEKQPCIQEAVKSALDSSTHADCMNAVRLVKIKMISNMLGTDKMGCLVSKLNSQYPIGSFNHLHILSWALQTACEESFPGICCMSFVNIPYYLTYKPTGNAGAHNVIKLSDGSFIGFDPEFFTHPRTYDELEWQMYKEFISAKDIAEKTRSEYKEFCKFLESQGGFEAFKTLRRAYQAQHKPYRFDVSKIERFIKTGEL